MVVGDAHLGSADIRDEEAFHELLDAVPALGSRLIVMGDLFDFWFEYRAVIPRRPFHTLTKLALLVERGISVDVFGGNHDRWGGDFWAEDLKIPFHADGADLTVAGRTAHVAHGDGLAEQTLGGKLIHRITRSRITVGAFRRLHPDFGFKLANRLSGSPRATSRRRRWTPRRMRRRRGRAPCSTRGPSCSWCCWRTPTASGWSRWSPGGST